jgi:4'-phosphopantetheinyl transferase
MPMPERRSEMGAPAVGAAGSARTGDLGPGDLGPGDLGPGDLGPGDLGPGDLGPGNLAPGEVHAWIVDLDESADDSSGLLDAAERDRAASYLSALDGARFAASRAALRRILSRYLGTDPAALRFGVGVGGRPVLARQHVRPGQGTAGLQFSLSRSASVALVAVSAGPASAAFVGADVEAIVVRDGLTDLAAARFGPAEAACVSSGRCTGSTLRSFYRHWTAREACLKAIGAGLAALRDVEFDCRPVPAVRFRSKAAALPGLRLHLLDSTPEYAVAIAATGPVTSCPRLPPGSVP